MTVQLAISTPSRDFSQRVNAPWTEVGVESAEPPLVGCALRFEQDREIYGEGEAAGCYYTVLSGVVRTCKFLSDGRRQIDAFNVAGDVFGIEPGTIRSLSAEAVSDCRVMVHRSPHFDTAVPPQLFADVIRNLARAQKHTVLLGRRSAVEKVAAFLLDWAQQSASSCIVALAMTRQDIGDYLGLTIETVSRTLSQLERDGIIELPSVRQITITDIEALTDLNG